MKMRRVLPNGAVLCLAMIAIAPAPAHAQEKKPNIIFILVDNVGWGDFGVYGGMIPTPRIDKLASEGIRFNNYSVECQCTPTRGAIMTGRLPVRTGTFNVLPVPGQTHFGLSPWEYTIAELLSDAGYSTALYGKWHVGSGQGRLPNDQGFDEWWGLQESSDQAGYTSYALFRQLGFPSPQILEGKKGEPSKPAGEFDLQAKTVMDEKIAQRTVKYIQQGAKANKPFFIYAAFTQIHPPLTVHPDFRGTSPQRGGLYADMVGEIDHRVGQILDAVKEAGIEKDTIIVFSSDNATKGITGSPGGSNGPWHGDFFTPPFEGSYRVSALVRWPGKVPAGVVTNEMLSAVDWLPTLAGLAGESKRVPSDRPIDGVDASAFFLGQSKTTGRDSVLYFGPDGQLMSVKWKYIKAIFRYAKGIEDPIVTPYFPMMYDLSSDPHEDANLWQTNMDMGWMFKPVSEIVGKFQKSVAQYPNIKPGEEFNGYAKQ